MFGKTQQNQFLEHRSVIMNKLFEQLKTTYVGIDTRVYRSSSTQMVSALAKVIDDKEESFDESCVQHVH